MARLGTSAALLLLLAAYQAAAWISGSNCKDQVASESAVFGVAGVSKPQEQIDQTPQWQQYGQITKLNLYYSWNFGCLQGIKATYGYKAAQAFRIGQEKNLYTQHLMLADYEHVVKVDVKQADNKCIEYLKLYTNKGKTLQFGSVKSTTPITTVTPEKQGGFLAALKGQHDLVTEGSKQVAGGLQTLQFVWGVEVCPRPSPEPVEKPEPFESPIPVDNPEPEPSTPEPVCPPMPTMCDTTADEGTPGYCPATKPYTASQCEGGCCVSSGKCKLPLCKLNGLGADVMALDFICYGKNNGPFGGHNKCRNLACKLAVPGCQSGLMGGHCVGTVEAVDDNTDDQAKLYIGKPCIELANVPGPLHMPLNKPGLPVPNGEYMGGLWSVCDCSAKPSIVLPAIPTFDLKKHLLGKLHPLFQAMLAGNNQGCQGPVCALLPQLPQLNVSLPDLQIPMTLLANLTALLHPKQLDLPDLKGIVPQIQLPNVDIKSTPITLPVLPSFNECVNYFVNITNTLKPAIEAVLPTPQAVNITDVAQLVSGLLPQLKFELPQLDFSKIPQIQLPDLTKLVSALLSKKPQFQVNLALPAVNLPKIELPEVKLLPEIKLQHPKVAVDVSKDIAVGLSKDVSADATKDVGVDVSADADKDVGVDVGSANMSMDVDITKA